MYNEKTRQDKTRPARAGTASSLPCNSETKRECKNLDNKLELQQNYHRTTPSVSSSSSAATNSGIESFEDVSCDDNNDSCTIDYCDNRTCVHEPKCVSGGGCQDATCNKSGECLCIRRGHVPKHNSMYALFLIVRVASSRWSLTI